MTEDLRVRDFFTSLFYCADDALVIGFGTSGLIVDLALGNSDCRTLFMMTFLMADVFLLPSLLYWQSLARILCLSCSRSCRVFGVSTRDFVLISLTTSLLFS